MKLNVHQIEEVAKELVYEEPTDSLKTLLQHGEVCDFEFPAAAEVRLQYYRAGQELFLQGHISDDVVGHCARCLEDYHFDLEKDFFMAMVPKQELPPEAELSGDELDLGAYEGDELDLSPLIHEQIILALPIRPLCCEDCKGLCPSCGVNLNVQTCTCTMDTGDPRLAVLRHLKVGH